MQVILSQMAVLFILLAIGFIGGKAKLLSVDAGKLLSKIVINITAPCTILTSVLSGDINITAGETAVFLLISFLLFFVFIIISIPVARLLTGDKANQGLYSYMAAFGNTAFMGFPVTIAIFGGVSAFYVALYNIPFNLLTFSVGVILISGKGNKFDPKILISPSIIAALAAILIAITGFEAPTVITESVRLIGNMTTPGSMLVIGSTLAHVSFRQIAAEWRLYPTALFKLIFMPVLSWLVLRQFISNELVLGVLVVLSGMPVAAMSAMVAIEYGGNERIASGGVSLTTLLSGVTIPLIVYLLLR